MYKNFFDFILDKKSQLLTSTFSFFVIGLLISLFLSNIYLSSSVIAPTRDNYQADSGSNVGGILASTIGFRSDEATPELKFAGTYLSSYKFLSNFIVKNDLVDELLRFRKYNKSDRSLVLKRGRDYSIKSIFPNGEIDYSAPEIQEAVKELRDLIRLAPGRENDPNMYLDIFHQSPEFALFLNQKLLSDLNESIVELDVHESKLKLEYINSILGSYNEIEVRKALSKIIESEISKQVLANSLENYSFMILDPPVLPLKKFSPRRTIICLTFALSALLIHIIILSISYGFKIRGAADE